MTQIVEVDARKRISLGAVAGEPGTQYMVEVIDEDTIVLTRPVIMSAAEAALLRRPDILAVIDASRANPVDAGRPARKRDA